MIPKSLLGACREEIRRLENIVIDQLMAHEEAYRAGALSWELEEMASQRIHTESQINELRVSFDYMLSDFTAFAGPTPVPRIPLN